MSHPLPHFKGLLRQLVLVPGSDATHQICPSSDPQLSTLSVPPLLLDLPSKDRQGNRHLAPYGDLHNQFTGNLREYKQGDISVTHLWHECNLPETEERVSVGLERSCSELLQGQLWFNPEKKGLYLCDGSAWVTVLEGEDATTGHKQVSVVVSER